MPSFTGFPLTVVGVCDFFRHALLSQRQRLSTLIIAGVFLFVLISFTFWHATPESFRIVSNPRAKEESEFLLDTINNSTLGFEDVFVVSLPTRTDHRDAMTLSAAVSDIKLNWIDGVKGEDVLDKVLPPGEAYKHVSKGNVGSWRAHLNALQTIVERNLTTALILEDDADWDIRIKAQLRDFALSSRALTQPLSANPRVYADPTYPSPRDNSDTATDIYFSHLPSTIPPSISPFGDSWDLLWLGHCGTHFPTSEDPDLAPLSGKVPRARVVHLDDLTVPESQYLEFSTDKADPRASYPQHTRFVHHVADEICSLGYAVTQAGARHILYEFGVKKFESPFDIMLREICEGLNGYGYINCLTVQPQLFNHHRPAGRTSADSDISDHGDEVRLKPETQFIRWSVRMNLERLVNGDTALDDQFPDSL